MITIPKDMYGQRIDVVLAQLFPDYSRSQLSQWLKEGKITVNDGYLKPKDKVLGGEIIHLDLQLISENKNEKLTPEAIPLNIVFEDDEIMVINKPADFVVHPGAGNPTHTLVNALLHYNPNLETLPRAGIIHRLDKDTTGLIIIAKTLAAHTYLIRQMQAREIKRFYLALVQGHVIASGEVNTFYGRHPHNRLKMAVREQGKEAITHYNVRKQYQFYTLLDIELFTGRTHQIRVHMAYKKHPIVGDPLYGTRMRIPPGANDELIMALQQFKRQALHAYTLSLIHPIKEQQLTFKAPLPDDFEHLLISLDNYIELHTP
ncbi:23S rRNA pseudouridine(1911/1915/1917) synthase RluD [Legionella gresilensis]|uniref:23S rRNA pseudouridine(1911/1915/1917) synthase RluD n=1 Tax=Legionella gresilensis TaxID=91823 RepID=UPI0010417DBC|nr:23S rRNA pseudouridine(1911/1915/1917) synthase RluD [Legionella gresilensis]